MASEEDLYVAQLHELFRSCDSCGDGLLSKNELVILCEQLELSPLQSYYMTDRLIGSDHLIKVDFDEFKEAFVDLLTQEVSEESSNPPEPVFQECKQAINSNTQLSPTQSTSSLNLHQTDYESFPNESILSNSFYLHSMDVDGKGVVEVDLVASVWESHGFPDARLILKDLGFESGEVISIQKLSGVLEEELTRSSSVSHSSTSTSSRKTSKKKTSSTTALNSCIESSSSSSGSIVIKSSNAAQQQEGEEKQDKNGKFASSSSGNNMNTLNNDSLQGVDRRKEQLFQIALISLQNEFLFLKNNFGCLEDERNRLRVSVTEANLRADLLAQEVDEHHRQLEISSNNKIAALEKKHQEDVRILESQLSSERESMQRKWMTLKKEFDQEKSVTLTHETQLKEQLEHLRKENKRMEQEMQILLEKTKETEKYNMLLQSKLEEQDVYKKKIEDVESMQILQNEQKYKHLILELEEARHQSKECQDLNDELLLEIDKLKKQIERKKRKESREESLFDVTNVGRKDSSASSSVVILQEQCSQSLPPVTCVASESSSSLLDSHHDNNDSLDVKRKFDVSREGFKEQFKLVGNWKRLQDGSLKSSSPCLSSSSSSSSSNFASPTVSLSELRTVLTGIHSHAVGCVSESALNSFHDDIRDKSI